MAEIINIHALATEFAFEPEDVQRMASMFFKSSARALEALNASIATGDYDGIYRAAHSLKGSAATLRLKTLQSYACEIEIAGREKQAIDYGAACQKLLEMVETIEVV